MHMYQAGKAVEYGRQPIPIDSGLDRHRSNRADYKAYFHVISIRDGIFLLQVLVIKSIIATSKDRLVIVLIYTDRHCKYLSS